MILMNTKISHVTLLKVDSNRDAISAVLKILLEHAQETFSVESLCSIVNAGFTPGFHMIFHVIYSSTQIKIIPTIIDSENLESFQENVCDSR